MEPDTASRGVMREPHATWRVLEQMPARVVAWSRDGDAIAWAGANAEARSMDHALRENLGWPSGDGHPRAPEARLAKAINAVFDTQRSDVVWMRTGIPGARSDAERTFELRLFPVVVGGDDEAATHVGAIIVDTSEQTRTTASRERVLQHLELVTRSGELLAAPPDIPEALTYLSQMLVPSLADGCVIRLPRIADDERGFLAAYHRNPDQAPILRAFVESFPPAEDASFGPGRVLRTGRSEFASRFEDVIDRFTLDAQGREKIRALGIHTLISVPLIGPEGPMGVISLGRTETPEPFDAEDLAVAEEVGRRVGAVLERGILVRRQVEMARAVTALEHMTEGLMAVDDRGDVVVFNRASHALFGSVPPLSLPRPAIELVPEWNAIVTRFPVLAEGEDVSAIDPVPLERGGRTVWIAGTGSAYEGGVVYTFRDVTDLHSLDRMKDDFVATVSHELRTPLAIIHGAAETLRRTDIQIGEEVRGDLLAEVSTQTARLGRIVGEILTARQLEYGVAGVMLEEVDVAAVVRSLASKWIDGGMIPDGARLVTDIPDGELLAVADASRVEQVISNLIDNAVRYSPDGGEILVALRGDGSRVRVQVADHGIGIPHEDQARVFDKFVRLDPSQRLARGGTGLGLYVCRRLVELMHGRIGVASVEGEGSRFSFDLPSAVPGRAGVAGSGPAAPV